MPLNKQEFQDKFSFENQTLPMPIMVDFQIREEKETDDSDDFAYFTAVIATGEDNPNYIRVDDKTLQNAAAAAKTGNIHIYKLHNRREFQMGTLLTGQYQRTQNRVTGEFNIIRDAETEVLLNRMEKGVVKDMSPTFRGRMECNVCSEKMYVWGGCCNDHYLGDVIKVEGKEITVTATLVDAELVEVSVVNDGAMPSAKLFSENQDQFTEAFTEGIINEKCLEHIEQSYSLSIPRRLNNGGKQRMATKLEPNEANMQVLEDNLADEKAKVAERDATIAEYVEKEKGMVTAEKYAELEEQNAQLRKEKIESESESGANSAMVAEYQACVEHVRDLAIQFYAKVRKVETDNDTDVLFVNRKKAIKESDSLTYLLGSLQQYQEDYYGANTQFGGAFKKATNTAKPFGYTAADGFE